MEYVRTVDFISCFLAIALILPLCAGAKFVDYLNSDHKMLQRYGG